MKTYHIERIMPDLENMTGLWPRVLGEVVSGPDSLPQFHNAETLTREVISGDLQLWVLLDESRVALSVALTKVFHYPKGPAFRIMWLKGAAGDPKFLTSLIDGMEAIARQSGCFRVEFSGRRGWMRLLRDKGYGELWTVMGRDITKPVKEN